MPFPSKNPCSDAGASRRRFLRLSALGLGALLGGGCERAANERPRVGDRFPDFSLPGLDGKPHQRQDYHGRPLMINFWATWCPPCRAEMADLEILFRQLTPKGLTLLAISVDHDANLVDEYIRQNRLSFPIVLDRTGELSNSALRVPGFPSTYLVGRDGLIKDLMIGPRAWASAAIQAKLAGQLELAA